MAKLKIVSGYPKNLNELEQIEWQDKINSETKELSSIPRVSFFKKSIVLGAITFFPLFEPVDITLKYQETFLERPSDEQVIYDISRNTDILSEIEKDIEVISTMQNPHLEERIDGEEIQDELEIVSNYMSNIEKYYETRKKRFKL